MDTPEVKSFNAELSGLYENKPPISKAKMSAITKGAIKAIKVYKHVVHSVEKFIQKCKPEYKVPGLYVIDSIVRQSRHQFGQDKDVFAPRFAKNMQQTFANLFRCPPEDKRNIIRVLNLWQKNNVFSPQVIQPLLDMADPNHPLHQEIQQQNNTANGSSLNISHNTSDNKVSPGPSSLHTPHTSSPMGDSFQDQPSGQPNIKFNRKLLNDFEYDSEDEGVSSEPPPQSHSSHTTHSSHGHSNPAPMPQQNQNPSDAMASILTNPEIMRQLQSLQAQMQMMTGMQIPNLMPMMSDMQQLQNQNAQNPFMNSQQDQQKTNDSKDDMANESDIEFVEAGPQVIEIPDANDSRSPSPKGRRRGSKSPRRRRRSRSRSPRRRRDKDRDRDRDRDKDRERDKDRDKNYKEREAEREKQKEREKKGLPPIKKENLSVCSCTLWVGHLSKLTRAEELWALFGAAGGVASIDVVAPRGCAFVVMERRRDAAKAKDKLHKHKLHSKEISVAWAPGRGVKEREWKEYWEAEAGVSYIPWAALRARWALGLLSLDALEDGGVADDDSLPPWLPPRILPKSVMENMSLLSLPVPPLLSLPPHAPPMPSQMPPELGGGALQLPAVSAASLVQVPRMPPPGMTAGMPPGLAPGMPPGIRPPSIPTGVPGLAADAGLPPAGALLRFPPALPPHSLPQPGMVGNFLGGLLNVSGLMPNLSMLHVPPGGAGEAEDDNMSLEEEAGSPGALLPAQLTALLSQPPPALPALPAAPQHTPPFNANQPPPFTPTQEKPDDDRNKSERERERRDRERERERRERPERREREPRRDRDRGNERPRERDRERDDRRERDRERGGGRDRRDRDRDRDRERFASRDNNNRDRSREKSPRPPTNPDNPEKSLQERLWEMANGKPSRPDEKPREDSQENRDESDVKHDDDNMDMDNDNEPEAPPPQWNNAPRPPLLPHHFRPALPDMRMRGPPRQPMAGPWLDAGPFGPRFNGMAPPFARPPFDGPAMFEGPPRFERPPFSRMPFDMSRPPFDGSRPPFDGSRPPFDGSRPPFDGPRPPFDGSRPPFDGPRPPFDGSRPPFDGPRPPFDGPRPPFDGPRPPFDGPRPPFDGPRPPFDGSRPPFDGPPRQFDGDRSFDGPQRFDGPPEFFDRNNRRFDEREQFDRGWDQRRGGEWEDRRRRGRDGDDRYRRRRDDRNERNDRPDRPDRSADRSDRSAERNDRSAERNDRSAERNDRSAERNDRSAERSNRSADRTDKPADIEKTDNKPERVERNERRKDKDRKSRWGAAEAETVEQTEGVAEANAAEVMNSDDTVKDIMSEGPSVPFMEIEEPSDCADDASPPAAPADDFCPEEAIMTLPAPSPPSPPLPADSFQPEIEEKVLEPISFNDPVAESARASPPPAAAPDPPAIPPEQASAAQPESQPPAAEGPHEPEQVRSSAA